MKKVLFIMMLGLIFANNFNLPSKEEISALTPIQKEKLYNDNSKKPLLAGILNLGVSLGGVSDLNVLVLGGIPSLGHAYTNNWKRGALLGISTWLYSIVGMFNTNLGYTIIYSGHLLQAQDAYYLTKKYNSELYKAIYNQDSKDQPKLSIIEMLNKP